MKATELTFKGVTAGSTLTIEHNADVWVLTFGEKTGKNGQYWSVTATCNGVEKYKNAAKTVGDWKAIITGESKQASAKASKQTKVSALTFDACFEQACKDIASIKNICERANIAIPNNATIMLTMSIHSERLQACKQAKAKAEKYAHRKQSRDERLKRLIKIAKDYKLLERVQTLTDVLIG